MDEGANTTLRIDYHRRADENEDEDEIKVSYSERIFLIVGVVVALIILQIIGCLICYKDKWVAKRKAIKNQQDASPDPNSNQPIEITEVLTSARQPKKGRVPVEDPNAEEAARALLPRNGHAEVNENPKDFNSEELPVVEVHKSGAVRDAGGSTTQSGGEDEKNEETPQKLPSK